MRTTIDLPDPLYKQIKALAAVRGIKLKQLIANALFDFVRQDSQARSSDAVPDVFLEDLESMDNPEALRAAYPRGYRIVGPLIRRSTGEVWPKTSDAALETMMNEEDLERDECAG